MSENLKKLFILYHLLRFLYSLAEIGFAWKKIESRVHWWTDTDTSKPLTRHNKAKVYEYLDANGHQPESNKGQPEQQQQLIEKLGANKYAFNTVRARELG